MATTSLHVGVFGAGAIGCYLGARLSAAGCRVTLVGRSWLVQSRGHIRAVALNGNTVVPRATLSVTPDPEQLADVDVCLVTVKSAATDEAGRLLAGVLHDNVRVLSLQNGITNTARLRAAGIRARVISGLVMFNIVRGEPATFRKATGGPIVIGIGAGGDIVAALTSAGEPVIERHDIAAAQTAKLLLNLNNGLCAATGLSIADSIASSDLRWCFSELIREGLRATRALDLPVGRIGRLAPPWVASLLRTPDFLFTRLAGSFMRIDAAARSSTLQDIDRDKPTEIDFLNGEILQLAARAGTTAPANAAVIAKVHAIEASPAPRPFWTPQKARQEIMAALAERA